MKDYIFYTVHYAATAITGHVPLMRMFSPLPSAEQTNITFRSNSYGGGRGFFMLVIQSNFSCTNCRARPGGTASALPWVAVPRLSGCPAQQGPTGLQGAPGRKGRGATSCVSRFLIQVHTLSMGHL